MSNEYADFRLSVRFFAEPGHEHDPVVEGVEIEGFTDDENESLWRSMQSDVDNALWRLVKQHMDAERKRAKDEEAAAEIDYESMDKRIPVVAPGSPIFFFRQGF